MSTEDQAGAGRREVAYRVFAAEYDDADVEYTENEDDERSPNYVVTPTGARVNRLFVVGVLTEVERVNEEMLRGRVVDPTGAFVVYAGQYQPDALTALERAEPPTFVAVTGKARTFEPEDADVIYTSIRPETINEVDADTRDRWTVEAARHTLDRVATFLDALDREERGEKLRAALDADGVDSGLAAGIPLAIQHYGTTTAYLDAVREMAIGAAGVVAGERGEVEPLTLAPGEGGDADVAIDAGASLVASGIEGGSPETAAEATVATDVETGADLDDLGDFDAGGGAESGDDAAAVEDADESEEPAATTDEMYEFDEDEREEIEEEFGTEFSTGSEIEEPGAADLDTPSPEETELEEPESETESGEAKAESTEPQEESAPEADEDEPGEGGTTEEAAETEADETEPPEPEEADADVDLEEAVVEAMRDLDDGDGAERAAVVEAVSDEYGASEDDVADAIQDALMSGKCYEPGDGRLKAI